MVLEDCDIVVLHSDRVVHVDQEYVVNSWVLEVMTAGGYQHGQPIVVIHFCLLSQFSSRAEVVESLAQVSCMGLVVIRDVFVPVLDSLSESKELLKVDLCTQ